ncbi:MBL fold metallo-hydrolase [Oscillatoriales cyanobacterium LEGE 11467]|uniref:MBL fold metallo-hydrolase n=1 Tax=Zarconia navalis LEGE 11467 TaxID=1828826 RepID=A0A928VUZ5_9CYAN|nr:MBL fold metallo-hydrolase [Zarconia navalis]MBE9039974.1 MBL fold metallo-hydrolase [Zarconia navalis LEGE 11467]
MYLTYLDSNSWLIEIGEKRILLDPWLVGPLVFGGLGWLFKGQRRTPRPIPENIDLILLSQGLTDHAHPPTLEKLDRAIPVVGSVEAAKVVRSLGYTQVTALAHGETFTLDNTVKIEAVPGSPIGPLLVENGYILRELSGNGSIYYEPHGYHSPSLKDAGSIDVLMVPIVNLKVPLLGPIIQGRDSVSEVAQWLEPQVILPTAAGGDVEFEGVLVKVLQQQGSVEELRETLDGNNLKTQVIEPTPGERFEVNLTEVQSS